jgi:hypothetical protein
MSTAGTQPEQSPERGESIRQQITLVITGALVGVLPVFVNSQLQARGQRQQARFDRRLTAMLDYSAACNRHAVALQHVANLPGIIAMWSAQLKSPNDQRLALQAMAGHADAALKDGYSTQADLATQRDRVNALFRIGVTDPVDLRSRPNGTAAPLLGGQVPEDPAKALDLFQAIRTNLDSYTPILKRHCGETAKLLAAHLEDP